MNTVKEALLKAVKNFPSWTDIRKRNHKSTGALYLRSIIEEQIQINEEIQSYIKDHFLLTYVGREEEIMDYAYVIQIGNVDISMITLIDPIIEITEDARLFLRNREKYCLYQNGYLVFDINTVFTQEKINDETFYNKVIYSINDYSYSDYVKIIHTWNIIDEFALFLGIERYDNEKNKSLMKRCFAVFQNKTDSSETGLKNTIINSVLNDIDLTPEEILVEKPNEINMRQNDSDGLYIYEQLAQLNKDVFRTKIWNMDTWEHNFKTIMYIPHEWNKSIQVYQDGVGQQKDLNVILNDGNKEVTDVNIYAYKLDREKVIKYVQKSNASTKLQLQLERYNDEIKPKNIQYKITASKAIKISPYSIYFTSKRKTADIEDFYLEDVITNSHEATVINNGLLSEPGKYKIRFFPYNSDGYCSMEIKNADIVNSDGTVSSILSPSGVFDFKDGIFINNNVAAHINKINQTKNYTGFENGDNCIKMTENSLSSTVSIDITGMEGKYVVLDHTAPLENISTNQAYISSNGGFSLTDDKTWISKDGLEYCTLNIKLKCSYITLALAENINKDEQGSIGIEVYVNGLKQNDLSKTWTKANVLTLNNDKMADVEIKIERYGMYPVEIKDIYVNRYEVETTLDSGSLMKSSFGWRIPKVSKNTNILRVRMTNYGTTIPQLNYIHIGSCLKNASYTTKEFESDGKTSLRINSNCRVQLLKSNGKTNELIKDYYDTHNSYYNSTSRDILMEIDVTLFDSITDSSIPINITADNGRRVNYISLHPGNDLSTIKITGIINKTLSRENLYNLFSMTSDQDMYISKNAGGFILYDNIKHDEKIVRISGKLYKKEADVFFFEGLPQNTVGYFISDQFKGNFSKTNSINSTFEEVFIVPENEDEYIAYNDTPMISAHRENIKLVNTFSPSIDFNELMFYRIEESINSKIDINFEKENKKKEKWSLGIKPYGLVIDLDIDYSNSELYGKENITLNQTFMLSNTIDLETKYVINGTKQELARFIITPPDELSVQYKNSDDVAEYNIIIEEDGFNKLYYSNISAILHIELEDSGEIIPQSYYSLLSKEGILIWNNTTLSEKSIIGKSISIVYKYKIPYALAYDDISYLYKQIDYNIDAFYLMNGFPKRYRNININEPIKLDFEEEPSKILMKCIDSDGADNPNFKAVYLDGSLKVIKTTSLNSLAVHSGYYYDDEKEYYFFANNYIDEIKNANRVRFIEVTAYGTTLYLEKAASNFVKNSYFESKRKNITCNIKCSNENKNLTDTFNMNTITACDSFGLWRVFDMDVDIVTGINEKALKFTSHSDTSYAVMNITNAVIPNSIITLYADTDLKLYLMKETLADKDSMNSSIFCERYISFERYGHNNNYAYIKIPKEIEHVRYYMVLTGTGVIDDIISKPYIEGEEHIYWHQKNIDLVGLKVEEVYPINYKLKCSFDADSNYIEGLEIQKDNSIITGTSINWGVTKIYDIKEDYDKCILKNVLKRNEAFYGISNNGAVKTPSIYIPNSSSINRLFIKINAVDLIPFKNLPTIIYGSNNDNDNFSIIQEIDDSNLIILKNSQIKSYLQILVEIVEGKVIDSIEIYAEYIETSSPTVVTNINEGTLITKVYDMGKEANYSLMSIEGDIKGDISFYVRGLKTDNGRYVWTNWYNIIFDENNNVIRPHEFEGYEMFQYKINIKNSSSYCLIKNFLMEVTS